MSSVENVDCCLQVLEKFHSSNIDNQDQFKDNLLLYLSKELIINKKTKQLFCSYEKILKALFDFLPDGRYCLDEDDKCFLHYLVEIETEIATFNYYLEGLDLAKIDNKCDSSLLYFAAKHCKNRFTFEKILNKYFISKQREFFSFIKEVKNGDSIITRVYQNKKLTVEGIVHILFEDQSFDINALFMKNQTLLKILCGRKYSQVEYHYDLIRKILQFKNLNIKDENQLYLHEACKHASLEVIKMFFEYQETSIDYALVDSTGKTAIFYSRKRQEIFDYLLKKNKFQLKCRDNEGKNILHYYCSNLCRYNKDIVQTIINLSESEDLTPIIDVEDENGNKPYFYAKNKDNVNIADLITPKGLYLNSFYC